MVNLQTAINEINNGTIEFEVTGKDRCTTEGEVVIYLKRLQEFEKLGMEPEDLKDLMLEQKRAPKKKTLVDKTEKRCEDLKIRAYGRYKGKWLLANDPTLGQISEIAEDWKKNGEHGQSFDNYLILHYPGKEPIKSYDTFCDEYAKNENAIRLFLAPNELSEYKSLHEAIARRQFARITDLLHETMDEIHECETITDASMQEIRDLIREIEGELYEKKQTRIPTPESGFVKPKLVCTSYQADDGKKTPIENIHPNGRLYEEIRRVWLKITDDENINEYTRTFRQDVKDDEQTLFKAGDSVYTAYRWIWGHIRYCDRLPEEDQIPLRIEFNGKLTGPKPEAEETQLIGELPEHIQQQIAYDLQSCNDFSGSEQNWKTKIPSDILKYTQFQAVTFIYDETDE